MRLKIEKYLKVLRIELEDLTEDLQLMAELYGRREKLDEITDYVFLENVSVLQTEISGIESLIRSINDIPIDRFTDLVSFVDYLDELFRQRTKNSGYPEGVYALVKRKLIKVSIYIESSSE